MSTTIYSTHHYSDGYSDHQFPKPLSELKVNLDAAHHMENKTYIYSSVITFNGIDDYKVIYYNPQQKIISSNEVKLIRLLLGLN